MYVYVMCVSVHVGMDAIDGLGLVHPMTCERHPDDRIHTHTPSPPPLPPANDAGGHYPAPVAILDSIKYGHDHAKPQVRMYVCMDACMYGCTCEACVSFVVMGIHTHA